MKQQNNSKNNNHFYLGTLKFKLLWQNLTNFNNINHA